MHRGGYVVVWSDFGTGQGICAQLFDAAGKIGGEIDVNAVATSYSATVVALSGGGFAVTWANPANPNTSINIQIFDAAGTKVGAEVTTAFFPGDIEGAGLGANQFVLVNGGGAGQRFDGSGAPVGAAFQLPNSSGFTSADVASLGSGDFVAVGKTSILVAIERYDASGALVGSQIIFDDPFNSPRDFSITGLSNGGFAVAWKSADLARILVRAYDAAGNAASAIISYPATGTTEVSDPVLTGLAMASSC